MGKWMNGYLEKLVANRQENLVAGGADRIEIQRPDSAPDERESLADESAAGASEGPLGLGLAHRRAPGIALRPRRSGGQGRGHPRARGTADPGRFRRRDRIQRKWTYRLWTAYYHQAQRRVSQRLWL